jgi:hypothetical protein
MFHWFTAKWKLVGREGDSYRFRCNVCGKVDVEKIECPY